MRRVLSIVTFITLIALLMTACAGGQASQNVNQEETAGGEVAATEEPTQASEAPTETLTPVPTETPTEVPTEAPPETPTETPTETTPTQAPPEAPATDEVNTVQVSLTEYTIDMPATLPPGPTTFEIKNIGSYRHNFQIEGQGIKEVLPTDLQSGQSDTLDVDLQPGTYEVICPVSDHAERGMRLDLTVTQASAEGPAKEIASAAVTEPVSDAYGGG